VWFAGGGNDKPDTKPYRDLSKKGFESFTREKLLKIR
jgi:hypothetical protein